MEWERDFEHCSFVKDCHHGLSNVPKAPPSDDVLPQAWAKAHHRGHGKVSFCPHAGDFQHHLGGFLEVQELMSRPFLDLYKRTVSEVHVHVISISFPWMTCHIRFGCGVLFHMLAWPCHHSWHGPMGHGPLRTLWDPASHPTEVCDGLASGQDHGILNAVKTGWSMCSNYFYS